MCSDCKYKKKLGNVLTDKIRGKLLCQISYIKGTVQLVKYITLSQVNYIQ